MENAHSDIVLQEMKRGDMVSVVLYADTSPVVPARKSKQPQPDLHQQHQEYQERLQQYQPHESEEGHAVAGIDDLDSIAQSSLHDGAALPAVATSSSNGSSSISISSSSSASEAGISVPDARSLQQPAPDRSSVELHQVSTPSPQRPSAIPIAKHLPLDQEIRKLEAGLWGRNLVVKHLPDSPAVGQ